MLYGNLTRSCLWLYRNLFSWLNAKRVKEEQGTLIPWERNPKWIDGWYSLIWVNYVEGNRVRCYSSCILEPGVSIIVSEVLRAKIDQRTKKNNIKEIFSYILWSGIKYSTNPWIRPLESMLRQYQTSFGCYQIRPEKIDKNNIEFLSGYRDTQLEIAPNYKKRNYN